MPRGFTGHVRAPDKDHLIALSAAQHGDKLRRLQNLVAAPPSWDSRTKNIVGAIKNQASCGSCWDFSGTLVVEVAFYLAGVLKPDQALSEQYTLSCGRNGGCSGDDNTTVLKWAKATGLPLTSDYGAYTARRSQCAWKQGMQLYKLDDWGFADDAGGNGITPSDKIQVAIMQFGCVGCAVAAGGSQFWNDGQGVDTGSSRSIDHDVGLIGWRPSGASKVMAVAGAANANLPPSVTGTLDWLMRNSWGDGWGTNGCAWVREHADEIGTEAVWGFVKAVAPPAPAPFDWANL